MAEKFDYTKSWLNEEDFPLLGFSRNWENPADYPTIEPDEAQVRRDMQSLHDEVKDYLNETLIPRVIAEDATVAAWQAQEDAHAEAEAGRVLAEETRVAGEIERNSAEEARERTIAKVENMTASAVTLSSTSSATAEITADPVTGAYNIKLGIPKGKDGEGAGDMAKSVYDPKGVSAPVAFRPSYTTVTMMASKWSGKTYSFEATYPKNTYDISIEVAPTATAEQFEAFGAAMICGSVDSNIATALGDVPTVDIPIIVKVVRK